MIGTRVENGVSTPHVLSMKSYAHTQENILKGTFYQSFPFYPILLLNAKSSKSYQSTNTLTIIQVILIPTYLKPLFTTTLTSRNNIIIMNKSQTYHIKQDNYSKFLINWTSAMTKQSPITLLNQVTQQESWSRCYVTYHNI